MELVYNVRLDKLLGLEKDDLESSSSVWEEVPENYRPCVRQVDWGCNGKVAVALNRNVTHTAKTAFSHHSCRGQPLIAVFDCNEPHMAALCSALDASSTEEKSANESGDEAAKTANEKGNIAHPGTTGRRPHNESRGWLMKAPSFYTQLSWHPHQHFLAAVLNDCCLDIWTAEPSRLLNDFDLFLSLDWSSSRDANHATHLRESKRPFPVAVSWINCEFQHQFQNYASERSQDVKMETDDTADVSSKTEKHEKFFTASKKLNLFKADSEEDIDSLDEVFYNMAIAVATSDGTLQIAVFNRNGDFIQESCSLLRTCDSSSFHSRNATKLLSNAAASDSEFDAYAIDSASFTWDENGRYVAYIRKNGLVNIVKYQLQLLNSTFNNDCDKMIIEVEIRRSFAPSDLGVIPKQIVHCWADLVTVYGEVKEIRDEEKTGEEQTKRPDLDSCSTDSKQSKRCVEKVFKLVNFEYKCTSEKLMEKPDTKQICEKKDEEEKPTKMEVSTSEGKEDNVVKSEGGSEQSNEKPIGDETDSKSDNIKDELKAESVDAEECSKQFTFEYAVQNQSGPLEIEAFCLSPTCLFHPTLYSKKATHMQILDSSGSVKLLDVRTLVEVLSTSSKFAVVNSKSKSKVATMMAPSPLGLAVACVLPGSSSVNVFVLPDLLALGGSDVKPETVALDLFRSGCCAGRDLWDLSIGLKLKFVNLTASVHEFCRAVLQTTSNESKQYHSALFLCSALTAKPSTDSWISLASYGLSLESTLRKIHDFIRQMFKTVPKSVWSKLDDFLNEDTVVLNDAVALVEYELLLLKEQEFMLLLPITRFVYDQVFLLFKCIHEKKFLLFINAPQLFSALKIVLFFPTLWMLQSSVRLKHYPVFEKFVQSVDVKQFFHLVCQASRICSTSSPQENNLQSEEFSDLVKSVTKFLRLFRPVAVEPKNFVSGVFSLFNPNSTKALVFSCVDVDSPMRQFPNPPESLLDDVRFVQLGVRPVTNYKVCSRCGRKQGLRAKKQFRWPLWEAMWDQNCVCGGSWRRVLMGVGSARSNRGGASAPSIVRNASGILITLHNNDSQK